MVPGRSKGDRADASKIQNDDENSRGLREHYLNFIHYRSIVEDNWTLFGGVCARKADAKQVHPHRLDGQGEPNPRVHGARILGDLGLVRGAGFPEGEAGLVESDPDAERIKLRTAPRLASCLWCSNRLGARLPTEASEIDRAALHGDTARTSLFTSTTNHVPALRHPRWNSGITRDLVEGQRCRQRSPASARVDEVRDKRRHSSRPREM